MRAVALAAAVLLALAGCRENFFDPTPGQTPGEATRVDLIAQNIRVPPGAENAVRIGFRPKETSVHLRVDRSSTAGRLIACPLGGIDEALPPESECLPDLPDGVREGLTLTGLGAVALVREGDPITIGMRIEYEEAGRDLELRLPVIPRPAGAAACKDNACNPIFELVPVRGGTFTATAAWTGGTGRLEVLEGRVLARAFSSTGIPYRIAGEKTGGPPLGVTATLGSPSEYALAFHNASAGDLTDIELRATWP